LDRFFGQQCIFRRLRLFDAIDATASLYPTVGLLSPAFAIYALTLLSRVIQKNGIQQGNQCGNQNGNHQKADFGYYADLGSGIE
jgi:hypothetical protein